MFLLLVLPMAAAALLPSGAAGAEHCENSESGQELLPVVFHAMRFTSCGGTETHNGWSTNTGQNGGPMTCHIIHTQTDTHTHTSCSRNVCQMCTRDKVDVG